jgi:hypothetical protein
MKTAKDMALQKGDIVTVCAKGGNDTRCIVNKTPLQDAVYCEVKIIGTLQVMLVHIRFLKIG